MCNASSAEFAVICAKRKDNDESKAIISLGLSRIVDNKVAEEVQHWPRAKVVELLDPPRATVWTLVDEARGAQLHSVAGKYISTNRNETTADNLGETKLCPGRHVYSYCPSDPNAPLSILRQWDVRPFNEDWADSIIRGERLLTA